MINAFLMSILTHAVQAIIGSGVFQEIERLVLIELSNTKTGAEKAASVKEGLKNVKGELGTALTGTANWELNLGIETAVASINTKLGQPATVNPATIPPTGA